LLRATGEIYCKNVITSITFLHFYDKMLFFLAFYSIPAQLVRDMTFEEIPLRMIQLGVDRPWLAEQCDYKPGTLAAILAPNGNKGHKTDKSLRRIWEALDREELRQKSAIYRPAPLTNTVTLTPTQAQFDRWMKAAYQKHDSFDDWAKEGLDLLADEHRSLRVASDETPYKVNVRKS
jgi:hypothetical protein